MRHTYSIKTLATTLILATSSVFALAGPPDPPAGKVWVLNHEMSDEFDANSPNIDIWDVFDKGDSWGPRTAAFDKRIHEAVKEDGTDNYYLAMNPMWYYEDERFPRGNGKDFFFTGGGMNTKAMQTYGYFEVRIKPSDFPMGSGVFMNYRGTSEGSCNEKYATELDLIENMGYTGPGAGDWNNFQHVNSHAKPYSDASGSCQSLPYESTNSGVNAKPLEEPLGFNTVGMWWKNENTAAFYNNDTYFGTITPTRDFNLPMPVIIVMETYTWGDNDENNATNPKPEEWMFEDDFRTKEQRAVMYDWVRVWKLMDIDASAFNNSVDNIKGKDDVLTVYPGTKLPSTLIYAASANRTIVATLYNPSNTKIAEATYNVTSGVRSIFTEFELESELTIANGYKIVYEIKDGNTVLETTTTTVNVVTKPLEKKLWADGIPTSLEPGKTSYNIDVKYEADTNCTVVIEIRKPDGSWFGGGNTNIEPGNGVASINVTTPKATTVGSNYFYKVYMHRKGYNWQDPQNTSLDPTIYFNVEEPLIPAINIVSAPTVIENNTSAVDVEFYYETYENGTLDITLINPEQEVVAREHRTERIGRRTITRTIDIASVLSPSDNYKYVIEFTPDNNAFETISDTLENVVVSGQQSSIFGNKNQQNQLKVFPNPATDMLNISLLPTTNKIRQIEVLDPSGKTVQKIEVEDNAASSIIDLANYSSSIYFLKIVTINNIITSSFLKQ